MPIFNRLPDLIGKADKPKEASSQRQVLNNYLTTSENLLGQTATRKNPLAMYVVTYLERHNPFNIASHNKFPSIPSNKHLSQMSTTSASPLLDNPQTKNKTKTQH